MCSTGQDLAVRKQTALTWKQSNTEDFRAQNHCLLVQHSEEGWICSASKARRGCILCKDCNDSPKTTHCQMYWVHLVVFLKPAVCRGQSPITTVFIFFYKAPVRQTRFIWCPLSSDLLSLWALRMHHWHPAPPKKSGASAKYLHVFHFALDLSAVNVLGGGVELKDWLSIT